jgi:hypothetical protein
MDLRVIAHRTHPPSEKQREFEKERRGKERKRDGGKKS